WTISWIGRIFETFLQTHAKFVEKFQLGARITRWGDGLVTPLHQSLGLGERPGLFGVVGGWHEEDLGGDIFGLELTGGNLWTFFPPGRSFDELEISDDHPFQVGHA